MSKTEHPIHHSATNDSALEPIAIIGMGCRYPGAEGLDAFWTLVRDGIDAITEIPPERWDIDEFYDPDIATPGTMQTRWGGFLTGIDQFDARFFSISPREAKHLDPQQRQLMEVAWEALEHSGQTTLDGSNTGVFIATLGHDYDEYIFDDYACIDAYIGTGNAHSLAANRLSYVFNLNGPSIAMDSACSGSLVAVHTACQSLRNGESTMAIAGGVNAILLPKTNIFFSKAGAIARDGRCKPFDARADGIVRSEGVGIVVLKRLSAALEAGDQIHAVILGSAINSDGKSNGMMAPNQHAQEALLREAYRRAGITPHAMQYIEAHGTGTPLGDATEIYALQTVLGANHPDGYTCAVGSIKSNIGHTEAAAGVAGIIKATLALKHRQIPPSLHYVNPNPALHNTVLQVQNQLGPWPRPDAPLIAGVSAFGIGGTNAHIVLAEYQQPSLEQPADDAQLLVLSARTASALHQLAAKYVPFLNAAQPSDWVNICATALQHRTHHHHRLAVIASEPAAAAAQLTTLDAVDSTVIVGQKQWDARQNLAFVFSGQGSHWLGMGRDLLEQEPVFRAALEDCDVAIKRHTGWSVLAELQALPEQSRLDRSDVIQPAIFAIQVALAALWQAWGVVPDVIVGHSLGEVAAAYVAGALSLDDAAQVVVHRSRLMQQVAGKGRTAVIDVPMEQAQFMLAANEDALSIAGSNSPGSTVISGDSERIEQVVRFLEQRNVFSRVLKGIDIAFHSPHMDPLRSELEAALVDLQPRQAHTPLYSTVTSERHDGTHLDATYWGRNLREPFLFASTFQSMLDAGVSVFLEVSPHPVLEMAMRQGLEHAKTSRQIVSSLHRQQAGRAALLETLGRLFVDGHPLAKAPITMPTQIVGLPSYAWQHETFWYYGGSVQPAQRKHGAKQRSGHPLLGHAQTFAIAPTTRVWETTFSATSPASMHDHRVHGAIIVPGAAYVELALAAAQASGIEQADVTALTFEQALFLPETGERHVQTILTRETADAAQIQIFSLPNGTEYGTPTLHAQGRITTTAPTTPTALALIEIQQRCREEIQGSLHYQRMSELLGLQYGPAFQAVRTIWRRDGEVLGMLTLPSMLAGEATRCLIHPSLLDAAFQIVTATLPMQDGTGTDDNSFLPASIGNVRYLKPLGQQVWVHAVLRTEINLKATSHRADITLLDHEGHALVEISDLLLLPLASTQPQQPSDWLYQIGWQERARSTAPETNPQDSWLIIGGEARATQLAQLLEAHGQRVHTITNDSEVSNGIAQAATTFGANWRGIVYLRGLETTLNDNRHAEQLANEQLDSLGGLLNLAQARAAQQLTVTPSLWIVTNGAQAVGASPVVAPQQASLWGFGRVLLREHSEMRVRLLDLDPAATSLNPLVETLLDDCGEEQLAIRGETHLACRLQPLQAAFTQPMTWRADATYVLTGGLGGLGLTVARWMVEQGARRLLLLGRTLLPHRSEWRDIPENTPQRQTIETIRELEALGASIHTAAVDVADFDALNTLFERYHAEGWPPIRGVIHAAGILHDQLISGMSIEALSAVIRPKILGTWNLHRALEREPLDCFVVFSSIAAVLGSVGQSNYAAGNAFMDAFAAYRRSRGLPAQSINWGPWAEVGMAARNNVNHQLAANGIDAFTPTQGQHVLECALATGVAQVVALAARWERWPQGDGLGLVAELLQTVRPMTAAHEPINAIIRDTVLALPEAERSAALTDYLQRIIARTLRISDGPIDPLQPINTLGLDSILALELKNTIQADTAVGLPLVMILQGPTISQFVAHILEHLQPNADDDDLLQLLDEIEELSLEETQAYLRQAGG